MQIPYKQIRTYSEKAVFHLGYLWESMVSAGIINPRTIKLFGNRENIFYDDYVDLFSEMKAVLEKRHIENYDEIVRYIEENLDDCDEFDVRHETFYVLGQLHASHVRSNMITASEANDRWGLPDGEVRQSIYRGKLKKYIGTELVRQSGKVWLVSELAMRKVYGEPKTGGDRR